MVRAALPAVLKAGLSVRYTQQMRLTKQCIVLAAASAAASIVSGCGQQGGTVSTGLIAASSNSPFQMGPMITWSYYPLVAKPLKVCLSFNTAGVPKARMVVAGEVLQPISLKKTKTSIPFFDRNRTERTSAAPSNKLLTEWRWCYSSPARTDRSGAALPVIAAVSEGGKAVVIRQTIDRSQPTDPTIRTVRLTASNGVARLTINGASWTQTTFVGSVEGSAPRQMKTFGDDNGAPFDSSSDVATFVYEFSDVNAKNGQKMLVNVDAKNTAGQTSRFQSLLEVNGPSSRNALPAGQ